VQPGDLVVFVVREDTSYQSVHLAGTAGIIVKSNLNLGIIKVLDRQGKIKAWRVFDWRLVQISER